MNGINKGYLLVIGLIFLSLPLLLLTKPVKPFSEFENRYLTTFPKFRWTNVQSGDFGKQMEQFMADQFPFRESWVTVKAMMEYVMNKRENNGVYAGKKGYLFEKITAPEIALEKQIESIDQFAQSINIPTYLMLVPNSAAILSNQLPRFAPIPEQHSYIDQATKLLEPNVTVISVFDALQKRKDEYIYYRTDHHWTTLGAYYAYRVFAEKLGITPFEKEVFDIKMVSNSFYGSLFAKSHFRHVEPDHIYLWLSKQPYLSTVQHMDDGTVLTSLYDLEKLQQRDQYPVFLGGNHAWSIIKTQGAPKRTLLVIKDSYAHSLLPFLTLHYDEIHVLDLRYYNLSPKDYATSINADEVLILYNVATFQNEANLKKLRW